MSHFDNLTDSVAAVDQDDPIAEPVGDPIAAETARLIAMSDDELAAHYAEPDAAQAEPDAEPSEDRLAAEAARLKAGWAATPGATAGMTPEAVDAMALKTARERLTGAASPTPSASSPIPPPPTGPGVGCGHQANGSAAVVSQEEIAAAFEGMASAPRFGPVPSGEYVCRVIRGEFGRSSRGTPGFKVAFEVIEGEFANRRIWLDFWLTGPALAARERELRALGLTDRARMVENLPPIIAAVRVARRQNNKGVFFNEVIKDGVRFIGFSELRGPQAAPQAAEPDPFDVDDDDDQAAGPIDAEAVQNLNEGVGQ